MFGRSITVVTLFAAILLLILIQTTNPNESGPVGIFAVFFLLYVVFLGASTWLIRIGSEISAYIRTSLSKKPHSVLSITRSYYIGSVVALAPVMLIGMQSVSTLGFYEVFLVILFEIIGSFYILKRT